MSALEQVVRPFQRPDVFDGQKIVPAVPASVSAPRLRWGEAGAMPTPVSALAAVNLAQETYTETKRTTQDVTITNPSDPSQFVVDRRSLTMQFDKASTQNVLQSALVADIDFAFSAFSSDIRAAFQPFDPDAKSGSSKVSFTFHPDGV